MALKKAVGVVKQLGNRLLGAGVLGDSLGSLSDSMLGQLSGQDQTDGGLDFPTGDGGMLDVVGKTGSFTGNTLKDIVDEGGTLMPPSTTNTILALFSHGK